MISCKQINLSRLFRRNIITSLLTRPCATKLTSHKPTTTNASENFETVFSFPHIKFIALINRLKVYHLTGSCLAIPSCVLLEQIGLLPGSLIVSSYIAITGGIVLSLASLPLCNIIGFLYISKDNQQIKISSVDFWGRRKDRIIPVDDWIPILDMPARNADAIYLQPTLSDGTKYKLLIKFGNVLDKTKMGQVLE